MVQPRLGFNDSGPNLKNRIPDKLWVVMLGGQHAPIAQEQVEFPDYVFIGLPASASTTPRGAQSTYYGDQNGYRDPCCC